jgi:hypothetical protein
METLTNVNLDSIKDKIDESTTTFKIEKMNSDNNCSICQCSYIKDEEARLLPCTHIFHKNCIDGWLKNNKTCPLCRENIF